MKRGEYTVSTELPTTARGAAVEMTEEEVAREGRYTNPDLHRRVDVDEQGDPDVDYPLMPRDKDGNPFPQRIKLGVWDGINSYRLTETFTHDEESETCEIP